MMSEHCYPGELTNILSPPPPTHTHTHLPNEHVTCGSLGLSTSTSKLIDANGKEHICYSVGIGPVDASYKAVDLTVKVAVKLLEYSIIAVTEGIDAIATTRVVIGANSVYISTHLQSEELINRTFSGTGADMDIGISSVRAYVGAINKMMSLKKSSEIDFR